MIALALLIYGIVAMVRGKFSLGKDKEIIGTRARILGAISCGVFPLSLAVGLSVGVLVGLRIIDMPSDGALMMIDFGSLIFVIVLLVVLSKRFYRQQQEELMQAEAASSHVPAPHEMSPYSVVDPDNPFASPTQWK